MHGMVQSMPQNKTSFFSALFISSILVTTAYAAAVSTNNCGGAYTYSNGTRKVTSDYGHRDAPSTVGGGHGSSTHQAMDIGMGNSNKTGDYGAYSTVSGKVVSAGYLNGYGNTVIVESNGVRYLYAHASSLNVTPGQSVSAGQKISDYSGTSTGNTTGAHIHYATMVQSNGSWVNVDPSVVENMITSGNCPGTNAFNQQAIASTLNKHSELTLANMTRKGGTAATSSAPDDVCASGS